MALDFPGVANNEIDVGNDSSLQITGAAAYMAWIKLSSAAQNIDLISKLKSSPRGVSLQTDDDPPDDTWMLFVIAKTSSTTMSSGWPPSAMAVGTWYHVCGQFVPSTAVQIWQDGVLGNENTTGVPANMYEPPTTPLYIGGRADSGGNFDGIMDDVRVYNRNLSAAEMQTIYAARGRDRILDGLVGRWIMREATSGTVASGADSIKDYSKYGNHGTPLGTLTYAESEMGIRG